MRVISPPKTYPPVGHCIYCNSTEESLSDEHIIPYGLGGNLVLPRASCKKCARQTGRVEQVCLRQMLRPFRLKHGIPDKPRHKKEQPKELPLEMSVIGKPAETHMVSITEYPEALVLPQYPASSVFTKMPVDSNITLMAQVLFNDSVLRDLYEKHGATIFKIGNLNFAVFAQMLAKIAHAYVAANETRPYRALLYDTIIHGKTPMFFVGSEEGIPPVTNPESLHQIEHEDRMANDGRRYVGASIRLFSGLATPRYIIPVG